MPAADTVVCLSAGIAEAGGAVAGHGDGAYFSNELDLLLLPLPSEKRLIALHILHWNLGSFLS